MTPSARFVKGSWQQGVAAWPAKWTAAKKSSPIVPGIAALSSQRRVRNGVDLPIPRGRYDRERPFTADMSDCMAMLAAAPRCVLSGSWTTGVGSPL